MFVIKYRKIFFSLSAIFVAVSLFAIFSYGLNFGIDFKGGAIMEVEYTTERPAPLELTEKLAIAGINDALIQETGDMGLIIRTATLENTDKLKLLDVLSENGQAKFEEKRFATVGPIIGEELKKKAWIALGTVVLTIILFIAFAFRKVSRPVSSWKYGVISIIALAHDIIIPTGIFAFLGYEINSLFVIALLAILGLSINDTIVVFDRVRENLKNRISDDFEETVGKSLEQTFTRSINTSLTTLFVLLTLYFIGPDSTQNFALALALGIFFGTYSSIFIASPLLVVLEKIQNKSRK